MSETGIYNICYNLEYHCQLLLLKTMAYQYWHTGILAYCFSVGLVPLQCSTELTVYNCEDHFHIHIFICSSNIWLSYVPAVYSPLHGFIWNRHSDRLPVGLLAQLVEHCTIIAEVMGSNPVQVWIFFRPSFTYGLSSVHNCEDHFHFHVFIRSSNIYYFHIFTVV